MEEDSKNADSSTISESSSIIDVSEEISVDETETNSSIGEIEPEKVIMQSLDNFMCYCKNFTLKCFQISPCLLTICLNLSPSSSTIRLFEIIFFFCG